MIMKAVCVLQKCPESNYNVQGIVNFYQGHDEDYLIVAGEVSGLTPGLHGMHVHEFGDVSHGCISAGEHFNPTNSIHGDRTSRYRHVGDFGNIEADENGNAIFEFTDNLACISDGPFNIIGRTLIVHADPDDLGLTNHPLSLTTGNSGGRVAWGIIGIVS